MKRMFYLIPVVLCLAVAILIVCSPVSAAMPSQSEFETLPTGGQVLNSGHYAVMGYTTTGADGNAFIWCWIEYGNGDLQDRVTAYTRASIDTVTKAQIRPVAWYTDPDEGTVKYSETTDFNYIPSIGISATVYAGNNYLTKGTAGHMVTYATRGSWVCGTTIIVE